MLFIVTMLARFKVLRSGILQMVGAALAMTAYASETYDVGLPHPRTNVPYEQALTDALAIADLSPNWEVARCEGQSMSPFFTERSLLLVKDLPFEKLREGMVAVYYDREGDLVAHKVVKLTPAGWSCLAFQNEVADPTPVTKDNFKGIAFGVLNAKTGPTSEKIASMGDRVLKIIGKTYE